MIFDLNSNKKVTYTCPILKIFIKVGVGSTAHFFGHVVEFISLILI